MQVLKADDVDLMIIAQCTPGFSGSDLANLVNVAALRAAKVGAKAVSIHDLEFARDKIMMGSERKFCANASVISSGLHSIVISMGVVVLQVLLSLSLSKPI